MNIEGRMGVARKFINGLFILCGCVLAAVLIVNARRKMQGDKAEPLSGFQVFCGGEEISALFWTGDCLWVGGRDGVKRLDIQTGEVLGYVAEDLELIYAAKIARASDGSIWVGHNGGVTVFPAGGGRKDFGESDLAGGRVNTILCLEDQVWVGDMEGASLFELRDGTWRAVEKHTKENGLLAAPVNVIACQEGALWFGSYLDNRPGGISIFTASGWQYLTSEDGLAHPYINCLLPLEDQMLAACGHLTAGGLNQIEEGKDGFRVMDTFDMRDGIPGAKVRWLYLDSSGYLWITTESDGILLARGTELAHPIEGVTLTWEQGLSDNEIKGIVEAGDYYFLAGRYGITRIERQAVKDLMESPPAGSEG